MQLSEKSLLAPPLMFESDISFLFIVEVPIDFNRPEREPFRYADCIVSKPDLGPVKTLTFMWDFPSRLCFVESDVFIVWLFALFRVADVAAVGALVYFVAIFEFIYIYIK